MGGRESGARYGSTPILSISSTSRGELRCFDIINASHNSISRKPCDIHIDRSNFQKIHVRHLTTGKPWRISTVLHSTDKTSLAARSHASRAGTPALFNFSRRFVNSGHSSCSLNCSFNSFFDIPRATPHSTHLFVGSRLSLRSSALSVV